MIRLENVTKCFDTEVALDHIDLVIPDQQICGLLGTNGAGKSTMMRLICGIEKCDEGCITIHDCNVYDNPVVKKEMFFCGDSPFYFSHSNGMEMAKYLEQFYDTFRMDLFMKWMDIFRLDPKRRIGTYSKGKKKQLSILLGLASQARYLFCDESFDGLDPAMRQAVKTLLIGEMAERQLTVVVSSHNLRELEDLCDNVILLHEGKMLLTKELEEMKSRLHRIQCVFTKEDDFETLCHRIPVEHMERHDTMYAFVAHGSREEVGEAIADMKMAYLEIMPLSLEDVFIMETEVAGYDIKKLLLETM